MKPITFDSGYFWDDPNIRWGDPAYILEPGDPGYVPPLPLNQPTTKRSKMKRSRFYPWRQADQVLWLRNYSNKLGVHAATLGLAAGVVTAAQADCAWIIYVLEAWLPAVRTWSLAATDSVTEALGGSGAAAMSLPEFNAPEPGAGVAAVNPGALDRIFALIQQIKDSGKCTDAIASDLGIVGSAKSGPDLATVKPELKASIIGGQLLVKWGWNGSADFLDLCEIQVDRGDGAGFKLLTYDSTPNYTDTQPFPNTPTRWTYKAIYRVSDAQVGQWSAPVSVTVGG